MKPTLLIIAAGLGSRYGGLKQIDPIGPNGEIIIDYSIYDAIEAGFGKLVFVIRSYFEDTFKEKIGNKFDGIIETAYAYQELDNCLDGFNLPAERRKPWGTAHAVLVAEDLIDKPFAVINADDYYGPDSFKVIKEYLTSTENPDNSQAAMVGFILRNTLSQYGQVARGVCKVDTQQMLLEKIDERRGIEKLGNAAQYSDDKGNKHPLTGDEIVSMNLWGFWPSIFEQIQQRFNVFLNESGRDLNAEFYIPTVIDWLIKEKNARIDVLKTHSSWFGITYKQDKPIAQQHIRKLVKEGLYPQRLWR